jgi:hypothetical protein
MGLAAALAGLLLSSTLTLWAAMAAGRAATGDVRFGWLAVELVTLIAALVASALASVLTAGPPVNALAFLGLFFVWSAIGYGMAGILVYVEYARRGRRDNFRTDLRGSLWIGRGGVGRPFGGKPRPR